MPTIEWNASVWDHDWSQLGGEEWSGSWGGSEAQWFGSLYPRLHRFLPASSILEIAPGYGRWTRYLLPACKQYIGVDLAQACVLGCQKRFANIPYATFVQNDGQSLEAIADASIDFVFSFDSLVHAEWTVVSDYLGQITRKLRSNGVAFIHHSNAMTLGYSSDRMPPHARGVSVSGTLVASALREHGAKVLIQECVNWGGSDELIDCLTLFGRHDAYADHESVFCINSRFMDEASIIASHQSPYSKISRREWALS